MGLNTIYRRDQDLWTVVLPLICYYIVEWHLSVRVVRQFGGLQTVAVQQRQRVRVCTSKSPTMSSMFHRNLI
jgi:hypothetical protein